MPNLRLHGCIYAVWWNKYPILVRFINQILRGNNMASPITTHVLDTNLGKPAVGVAVVLSRLDADKQYQQIAAGETNKDGRIVDWMEGQQREAGIYRIEFATDPYFEKQGKSCFFPTVTFDFRIENPDEHYHVPLLVSAFGISTYRGS
jgi:5-hydroxyisourate hydrolase